MNFKTINKYVVNNFDSLTTDDFPVEKQEEYCLRWLEDYSKISKSTDDKILIDWTIREWRAIKEIYAAAIFYKEAEFSYRNRCMAACYFLLYYSLFHGMLSSLCYDVNMKLKEITEITHSKLGNIFKSTFCNGKKAIIQSQIYEVFLKFRYLREYYSYTPPLNMPMYDEEYLEIVDAHLTKCFQLTNLQSLLLERSFQKHGKVRMIQDIKDFKYLYNTFNDAIAKKDIKTERYLLDPADENRLNEIRKYGIGGFQCIGLQLDHTFDEFRLYDGSSKFFDAGESSVGPQKIYGYIYNKII